MSDDKSNPDKLQQIDQFQIDTATQLVEVKSLLKGVQSNIRVLSETLAAHIHQNIEATQRISDYIGEQMTYRLYRQNIEENNIQLQLAQKKLELDFAEKRLSTLESEKKAEDEEQSTLILEHEKQKLELENLRKSLAILQNNKHSTKEKINTLNLSKPLEQKMKEAIIMTALGTLTAAGVTGLLAFIIWFVRFYIQNTP